MAFTYGTSVIPGDTITVREQATSAISVGFDASVTIVGGYDAVNGTISSSNVGTPILVSDGAEAADKFGEASELHRATQLAYGNGADTVHAVAVAETAVTGEDPSTGTAGELANAPVMDPNVQTEHDITDQNGNTINVSYDVSGETVSGTEGYVNPVNGNFKGDGTTTYLLDYTYGDYSQSVLEGATKEGDRAVVLLSENESVAQNLITEVSNRASDFTFQHAVVGSGPEVADPTAYTDNIETPWAVVVPHSRGIYNNSAEERVRTMSAVGGAIAGSPLTESTTGNELNFIKRLHTSHTPTEISGFGDAEYDASDNDIEGVTPLIERQRVEIVEDLTADPDGEFRALYKHEIVNDLSYSVHLIARDFVSKPNFPESREQNLEVPVKDLLKSAASQRPPLLSNAEGGTPYTVSTGVGATDDIATLTVALDPLDVTKTVKVNINVGDIVTFEGASA